jgi:hypothetical protein
MCAAWVSVEEIRAKLSSMLRHVTELDSIINAGGETEDDFSQSPHLQTVWFSVEEIRAKLNSMLRHVTELDSIIGAGGEIESDFDQSPHREKIEMAAQVFKMLKEKSTLKNQTFLEECAPLLNNLKPALALIAGELQQCQREIDAIINILYNAQKVAAAHALFKKEQTKDSVIQLVENDNFDCATIEYLSIARKWGADIRADWDMLRQFPTQRAISWCPSISARMGKRAIPLKTKYDLLSQRPLQVSFDSMCRPHFLYARF